MIEIKKITKGYDRNIIFRDFSMIIPDASFILFTGKSGCGKTTLLNIIGGLEKPDSGSVIVDGKDIYSKKNMRWYFTTQVAFLFQNFALIEDETVEKNLSYIQKNARSGKNIDEVLAHIGLQDKKNIEVYKLSGGEQQRVALARLMLKRCNIILADEPTGSLDPENSAIVMNILHELNSEGKTVVLVTHNEQIINSEGNCVKL